MAEYRVHKKVTIANGASLSGVVELKGLRPVALIMPAGWTTAYVTFQTARADANYANAKDSDGSEITTTQLVASQVYPLSQRHQIELMHADYIKVRSGTSGTPTTQSSGDDVVLVTVRI